jgi:hypothetical protein
MKFVDKIKIHVSRSIIFFRKSCRLCENVEKYCGTGQATDDNMAHAHRKLYTKGYKHRLRKCNIYCFSTETMVAGTHLNVTLHNIACNFIVL